MRRLGELEASVMDVLWNATEPMKVRDVLAEVNRDRELAYTTIMTVLDNLHRKDWVVRELDGRAYRTRRPRRVKKPPRKTSGTCSTRPATGSPCCCTSPRP